MNHVDKLCNSYALRLKKSLDEREVLPGTISSIDYIRYVVESEERYDTIHRSLGEFATQIEDKSAEEALKATIFKFDMHMKIGNWPFLHLLLAREDDAGNSNSEDADRIDHAGLVVNGHLLDFKKEHPELEMKEAERNSPDPMIIHLGEDLNMRIDDMPLSAKLRLGLFAMRQSGLVRASL